MMILVGLRGCWVGVSSGLFVWLSLDSLDERLSWSGVIVGMDWGNLHEDLEVEKLEMGMDMVEAFDVFFLRSGVVMVSDPMLSG